MNSLNECPGSSLENLTREARQRFHRDLQGAKGVSMDMQENEGESLRGFTKESLRAPRDKYKLHFLLFIYIHDNFTFLH